MPPQPDSSRVSAINSIHAIGPPLSDLNEMPDGSLVQIAGQII